MRMILLVLSVAASLLPLPAQRPFHMGFTPFPYAISQPAVDYTYATIASNADLIAHHFDNGVPWPEALSGAPFSAQVQGDWAFRRAQVPPGSALYLSVTPINLARDGLALYRGEAEDMPLPAPWDTYDFDHPDVMTAYLNYVTRAVDFFQPDYLNIGIEANLLMKVAPQRWAAYATLHQATYTALKERYPHLFIFVSLTGIDLIPGYTDANPGDQQRALADLIDHTDILALSVYPYFTRYMTASIPDAIFNELAALTDKQLAIAETGYPAETFSISGGGLTLTLEGTPEKQAAWARYVLESAAQHNMAFVINFVLRDYDDLWLAIGGRDDLTIAWRDTGLFAGDGSERPALAVWREWLAVPYSGPGSS